MENFINIKETDLLIRYFANETTVEENEVVQTWLTASQDNKNYFEQLRNLWEDTGNRESLDRKFQTLASWEKVHRLTNDSNRKLSGRMNHLTRWVAIAASILLIVTVGLYLWNADNQKEVKISSYKKIIKITLPDSSIVWLNRNSELIYKKNYNRNRSLKFSGEGYFEVKPDASNPFVIFTHRATITVLGTKFNVHAYPGDSVAEVVVKSGKVRLSQLLEGGKGRREVILTAGEKGIDSKESSAPQIKPADDPNYLSWKTREFVFNNTNIKDIVSIINNVYDVNIVLDTVNTQNCNLTGRYNCQSLNDILDMLQIVLNIKIEKAGTNIIIKSNGC